MAIYYGFGSPFNLHMVMDSLHIKSSLYYYAMARENNLIRKLFQGECNAIMHLKPANLYCHNIVAIATQALQNPPSPSSWRESSSFLSFLSLQWIRSTIKMISRVQTLRMALQRDLQIVKLTTRVKSPKSEVSNGVFKL